MNSLYFIHFNIDIPSISIVGPTIKNVEYGSNVTLNCNVISFPVQTHVYWQRISNGTRANVTSDNSDIVGVKTSNPSLTILKARTTDSGLYACYAMNIVGTGHSDAVNLTVIGGKNNLITCFDILVTRYIAYWKDGQTYSLQF